MDIELEEYQRLKAVEGALKRIREDYIVVARPEDGKTVAVGTEFVLVPIEMWEEAWTAAR